MSSALAIAGVTAVLRDRLNDWLIEQDVASLIGSAVTISVAAPDRVVPADGTEQSQLNIFLYQVSRNLGWANNNLPTQDPTGRFRLTNAPLGLDLHYLISAYSGSDLHAEILLGYAVQLMHEVPVLTREMIRSALNPAQNPDLPPALSALADSGLADQVEQLRITPQYYDTEEISKLWTATQSSYRPTAAYDISVVLIEGTRQTRSGLPVLTRGEVDPLTGLERGVVVTPSLIPPLPTIETVEPAGSQPAAALGQTVTLHGHHLGGASREVLLRNDRFHVDEGLAGTGPDAEDRLEFVIPVAQVGAFPAGVYEMTARMIRPGETDPRETNRVALVVAPEITNLPQNVARDGDGDASFTLTFTPAVAQGQQVTLLLGQAEFAPEALVPGATSLNFVVEDAPVGKFLARLRVDGIESAIVDRTATPPEFLDRQVTIT
jgi:hypothetical protein